MKQGFNKMSVKRQEQEYGGWAWLIAMVPLLLQTIMTGVSSYKMLTSKKGSVKFDGADSKWDDSSGRKAAAKKTSKKVFYDF
ncbi:MAG: hypothetical protein KAG91_02775 [Mycoplasmataceae bacterium]|nr:hypothetical protein [Mycoplasmataceae bacterium]